MAISTLSSAPYALADSDKAAGRYIVVLEDNIPNPSGMAEEMAAGHGLALEHIYQHALKGYAATIPEHALADLKSDPTVKYIEPDSMVYAFGQTIPTGIKRPSFLGPCWY
ncbi:MAG: protease inhibitor I9 family protein [bacterium]